MTHDVDGPQVGFRLDDLDPDVLVHILSQLSNPSDLTTVGLVNRKLHSASCSPQLWRLMCFRKWHNPNSRARTDWRALFATYNALLDTPLHAHILQVPATASALACSAPVAGSSGDVQLAVGCGETVQLVTLRSCQPPSNAHATPNPEQPCRWQPAQLAQVQLPQRRDASAVAFSDHQQRSTLYVGTYQGTLHSYTQDARQGQTRTTWKPSSGSSSAFASRNLPVAEILSLSGQQGSADQLAVLYDHMLASSASDAVHPGPDVSNTVDIFDPTRPETRLCAVRDCMEGWQVACMARTAGPTGHGALLVGSVAGPSCQRCWDSATPWLCHHKLQARSAALCLVETRTPLGLAARFSLQHRSLYPRVASARDHYVFTSHADRPMCVWDLRKMSVPLFEQDRLDNMQRGPLGSATIPAEHQALWLTATSDVIVGRADNGCMWVWDLSTLLGWADGSGMGWWEAMDEVPDLRGRTGWPRCLGAPPLGSSAVPATHIVPLDGVLGVATLTSSTGWTKALHVSDAAESAEQTGDGPRVGSSSLGTTGIMTTAHSQHGPHGAGAESNQSHVSVHGCLSGLPAADIGVTLWRQDAACDPSKPWSAVASQQGVTDLCFFDSSEDEVCEYEEQDDAVFFAYLSVAGLWQVTHQLPRS